MNNLQSWMVRPMAQDVLQEIFASDQDMYPAPLTYARLQSWVDASPELSRCFYLRGSGIDESDPDKPLAGAAIVLPLKEEPWRNLLVGKLRETDVDAPSMFAPDDGAAHAIGLHVFHVERYSDKAKGFAGISLMHAQQVAEAKGWVVLGCSALTATQEGANSFARMNFEATGYEEIWIERDGEIILAPVYPGCGRETPAQPPETTSIVGQARMVARYQISGKSIVR